MEKSDDQMDPPAYSAHSVLLTREEEATRVRRARRATKLKLILKRTIVEVVRMGEWVETEATEREVAALIRLKNRPRFFLSRSADASKETICHKGKGLSKPRRSCVQRRYYPI